MTRSRRLLFVAGLVVLLVAAGCGSSTPIGVPAATAHPTPAASDAAGLDGPSVSIPPSVPDPALEARLPASLNGVTLTKNSFRGSSIVANPDAAGSTELLAVLKTLGRTPDDLSEAFAGDSSGSLKVSLGAIRVAGADGKAALAAFVAENKLRIPAMTSSQATIGGKQVTQISNPSEPIIGDTYVYANGDTLFYATSPDKTLAAAALAALP